MSYGVPLTRAEAVEIDRRLRVQYDVDPAIEFHQSLSDSAGAYMDQQAGGIPVLLTTGDVDLARSRLVDRIPDGIEFRVLRVTRSRAELEELQRTVWEDRPTLRSDGVRVTSAALDIRNNTVVVGIDGLNATATNRLARYGSGVVARNEAADSKLDACNSRNDCWPMKGGIKMYEQARPVSFCTTGFIVRPSGPWTTTRRVLTAGHCLELALEGVGADWYHASTRIGYGQSETWANLADADAGLVSAGSISGSDNMVMAAGTSAVRTVIGWISTNAQNTGDFICRAGAKTGFWCGNITLENRTRDVDGKNIEHQWVVNFDADGGDSGGPYLTYANTSDARAWGIHSDSLPDDTPPGGEAWYSPMGWVFDTLIANGTPVVLCIDADC
jgi:hypothetical protein